jgi:hypothetical protein
MISGKQVRLFDFQISASPDGLSMDDQAAINRLLFTTYEPVRLWLREQTIKAPFCKIAVTIEDERTGGKWHGSVMVAVGLCEVTEAVDLTTLRNNAQDHRWVLGIVAHALSCVAREIGWSEQALNDQVAQLSEKPLPLVHFFEKLTQTDPRTGTECRVWFSTQPGSNQVGVRFSKQAGTSRDVIVASKPRPLYLEDTLPVAKSAIRGPNFVLLDKKGKTLASVPMDAAEPH